ncbi:hypothetical protein [Achromobacter xylosoxidans]|uniref:hypothetical protein n=1 Tax=Alcaligenes xylosoxydans xylosoxydans TaxID=85698 RepID=UPI00047CE717|nr:hypothetical protein [Achromobacter xylosoxidans]
MTTPAAVHEEYVKIAKNPAVQVRYAKGIAEVKAFYLGMREAISGNVDDDENVDMVAATLTAAYFSQK